jgi:hypothetical protein
LSLNNNYYWKYWYYIQNNSVLKLNKRGLKIIDCIKKNMTNKIMDLKEKIYLRKRKLIEIDFNFLKKRRNRFT